MNLTKLIAVLSAVVQLLPTVSSIIQSVESAFPAGSPGATKLGAVESALESVYSLIPGAEAAWADVWPVLQKQVAALVAVFNTLGIFKHAAPTAVTAAK